MTSQLHQDFIPTHPANITLHKLTSQRCSTISKHVRYNAAGVLGFSLRVTAKGTVDAVAFATPTEVFHVALRDGDTRDKGLGLVRELGGLLDNVSCPLAGFNMARLALHLYGRLGVHAQGVDLSTLFSESTRKPQTAAEVASNRLHPDVGKHRIHALWYHNDDKDVCLRAWLSAVIAQISMCDLYRMHLVNTRNLRDVELKCLSELVMNVELLEAEKPTQKENEFEDVGMDEHGHIVIHNARYNNRVRRSNQTAVFLESAHGHTVIGHAVRAEGKETGVKISGGNFQGNIQRIRVVGREEYTHSELARDEFILLLLQGAIPSLTQSSFICMLWFPTAQDVKSRPRTTTGMSGSAGPLFDTLNPSQKEVVNAMWSDEEPLVIAHGPPGTGKTTTIAAAIEDWDRYGDAVWVIAQSNVGVKNIARTFIKHKINFRLLVSKEFYVEWHEHLYEGIEERLIRSDELCSDTSVDAARRLDGATVILSTVAMLSNPGLDHCGIFQTVPVERLVVDEASQIDSFDFMHLFHKFKQLEKLCMFGDPKQLPPYGTETAPLMKTIFDLKQLKPSAYFLNTQYRMPVQLGEFISEEVYNSKLKSVHRITDSSCVRFVNVRKGSEQSIGSSWKNMEEVHAVVSIVKNYYRHLEFCIITPYDAQRAAIAQRLEAEGLPFEAVYNVDSFQGHEARFVIVSTVRTASPGFLHSLNRMNVMLTRCKEGMVLVTNLHFLNDSGRNTLLGKLVQRWTRSAGRDSVWIDSLMLSDRRANLPGAPGRVDPPASRPVMPSLGDPRATSVSSGMGWSAGPKWGSPTPARVPSSTGGIPGQVSAPTHKVGYDAVYFFQLASATSTRTTRGTASAVDIATTSGIGMGRRLSVSRPSPFSGRTANVEEHFPALGEVETLKTPALRGKWRKGSEPCKL